MFFTLFFFSIKFFQNFRKKPFRVEKRQEISFFLILLFYKDLYIFFGQKGTIWTGYRGIIPNFLGKNWRKTIIFLNNILGFPKNEELVGKKPHWKTYFFAKWNVFNIILNKMCYYVESITITVHRAQKQNLAKLILCFSSLDVATEQPVWHCHPLFLEQKKKVLKNKFQVNYFQFGNAFDVLLPSLMRSSSNFINMKWEKYITKLIWPTWRNV